MMLESVSLSRAFVFCKAEYDFKTVFCISIDGLTVEVHSYANSKAELVESMPFHENTKPRVRHMRTSIRKLVVRSMRRIFEDTIDIERHHMLFPLNPEAITAAIERTSVPCPSLVYPSVAGYVEIAGQEQLGDKLPPFRTNTSVEEMLGTAYAVAHALGVLHSLELVHTTLGIDKVRIDKNVFPHHNRLTGLDEVLPSGTKLRDIPWTIDRRFLPPEIQQNRDDARLTTSSGVYAFGIFLMDMLFGANAHQAQAYFQSVERIDSFVYRRRPPLSPGLEIMLLVAQDCFRPEPERPTMKSLWRRLSDVKRSMQRLSPVFTSTTLLDTLKAAFLGKGKYGEVHLLELGSTQIAGKPHQAAAFVVLPISVPVPISIPIFIVFVPLTFTVTTADDDSVPISMENHHLPSIPLSLSSMHFIFPLPSYPEMCSENWV